MKILDILREARKNPEQNPKTPINAIIQKAYDETSDMVTPTTKNLFVSFTEIDKLGINPTSKYDTPIGIYSYPAEYVVDKIGEYSSMADLPFAGKAPYVSIFKAKGNIIDVGEMYPADARKYFKLIADLWVKESGKPWKTAVDEVEKIVSDSEVNATFSDYPGGRFWYVVMRAADQLFAPKWGSKTAVAWNKLFRLIGIDGCLDRDVGIIHSNESTQCVFFSLSAITDVKRANNKYSPADVNRRKAGGEAYAAKRKQFFAEFDAMSPSEIVAYFKTCTPSMLQYINNKKARMMILSKQPSYIQFIPRPTEQEKMFAVTANIKNLRYLKKVNVSDDIIIAGLVRDPDAGSDVLAYNPTPSEPVMIALVRAYPHTLFSLNKPTPAVVQAALASGTLSQRRVQLFAAQHNIPL